MMLETLDNVVRLIKNAMEAIVIFLHFIPDKREKKEFDDVEPNNYWVLLCHEKKKDYIGFIELCEDERPCITGKFLTKEDIKKKIENDDSVTILRDLVANNYFLEKEHFEGHLSGSNLTLNFKEGKLLHSSCAHMLLREENYWQGLFLKNGLQDPSWISLTKIKQFDESIALIKNSQINLETTLVKNLSETILLSIIITACNDKSSINNCIESLIKDVGLNAEKIQLIFIDNGSTDNTYELIVEYCKKLKDCKVDKIKILHKDSGVVKNIGLTFVKGKYVMFVDARDCMQNGIMGKIIQLAQKRDDDIIIGGYKSINELGNGNEYTAQDGIGNRRYTIEEFILNREKLDCLRLGASWGKMYKSTLFKVKRNKFHEGHFCDTIFNIELQKDCKQIYIDSSVWYQYDESQVHTQENSMTAQEFTSGLMTVLLHYNKVLNTISLKKTVQYQECFYSYYTKIESKIEEKLNRRSGGIAI